MASGACAASYSAVSYSEPVKVTDVIAPEGNAFHFRPIELPEGHLQI